MTRPRVSDLMRGRIDLFSIDTRIDMLARLGIRTKLVLRTSHTRAGVAERTVQPPPRAKRAAAGWNRKFDA